MRGAERVCVCVCPLIVAPRAFIYGASLNVCCAFVVYSFGQM